MVTPPPARRAPRRRNAYASHRQVQYTRTTRRRTSTSNGNARRVRTSSHIQRDNQQRQFRSRVRAVLKDVGNSTHVEWWNSTLSCSKKDEQAQLVQKFFPLIPMIEVCEYEQSMNNRLFELEKLLLSRIPPSRFSPCCRFDGNRTGINLGCTVVNGGQYSNSISAPGTIARIPGVKKSMPQIRQIVRDIFISSFGERKWFVDLMTKMREYVVSIHGEKGLSLLFAGLPITAVWISYVSNKAPHEMASDGHVDDNVIGSSFVLTTTTTRGVQLVLDWQPKNKTIPIRAGEIVAGKWPMEKHYNIFPAEMTNRISWVFYFDRRVLQINKYTLVVNDID